MGNSCVGSRNVIESVIENYDIIKRPQERRASSISLTLGYTLEGGTKGDEKRVEKTRMLLNETIQIAIKVN